MNRSAQVINSLRILGLPPDATSSDIRAAFRQLARTFHPDVAGRRGAYKFEQITGAYTFLKKLDDEEFQQGQARAEDKRAKREREAEEAYRANGERAAREAAAEAAARAREAAVDSALADGEQAVAEFLTRAEREASAVRASEFVLRLSSAFTPVRHLALSNLGVLANRSEVLDAMLDMLRKRDIDEKTARLVAMLPLDPENRQTLASQLADRASAMPGALLACLLRLTSSQKGELQQGEPRQGFDRGLWERYIPEARADGVALLLRYWPQGPFISDDALKRLLSRKEEAVLVPLFCAMKQRAVPCPAWGKELLSAHLTHPSAGVRLWARALLHR